MLVGIVCLRRIEVMAGCSPLVSQSQLVACERLGKGHPEFKAGFEEACFVLQRLKPVRIERRGVRPCTMLTQ